MTGSTMTVRKSSGRSFGEGCDSAARSRLEFPASCFLSYVPGLVEKCGGKNARGKNGKGGQPGPPWRFKGLCPVLSPLLLFLHSTSFNLYV